MKKILLIIPLILLSLSACGSRDIALEEQKTEPELIELASFLVNDYNHHTLDFNSEFELSGTLPMGINIMPVLDKENQLELYGVAKEKGEFFFTLTDLNDKSKNYKLEVIEAIYHQNSWQELIADDCLNFYDGCNHCSREEILSSEVMCTEMYCERYNQPYCLD